MDLKSVGMDDTRVWALVNGLALGSGGWVGGERTQAFAVQFLNLKVVAF